jgi:6-pyruvoyltetrahydropterin/6-carboxytetrahydropterin synthase
VSPCLALTHKLYLKVFSPMFILKRRYHFSAAHRLSNPAFSDEKNWAVFDKCNNPNGHGHNYELEVMVAGSPYPDTGMLMDLAVLDALVETHIVKLVDHKHLNLDVAMFEGINPTAENIAIVFYRQLQPFILAPASLHGVRLVESKNNAAEYYGA